LVKNGHLVKVGDGYPTYQPGTPTTEDLAEMTEQTGPITEIAPEDVPEERQDA
jgi:hypothetical protein